MRRENEMSVVQGISNVNRPAAARTARFMQALKSLKICLFTLKEEEQSGNGTMEPEHIKHRQHS